MIALDDVHLTLGSAAGPVPILRGLNLTVDSRRGGRRGRPVRLRQVDHARGDRRAWNAPRRVSVHIAGTDITGLDEDALARFRRDNIGIVFQAFHLIPTMSALENVAVPLGTGRVATDAFEAARAGSERQSAWTTG